jgi:F420-dependent oxidoreductase-like protein
MELGIHIFDFNYPDEPESIAPALARAGEVAEGVGATWLSVMDHYFQMDRVAPAEHPMLEAYTTLGYLAGHTSTIQLGVLVTGVTYRYPGLLAKTVTTLDVLSEGRGTLGIGAAWYEREHDGLGVPFPATAERFERLEETLQICRQMWDPEANGPFEGRHYRLEETLCRPAPVSRPRPEVLIGGSGERKTLRLVAQYADVCNIFAESESVVAHKLDVLRRHCDDVGRDEAEIRKTILYQGPALAAGDTDAFLDEMGRYAKLGVDQVMVLPFGRPDEWIEKACSPLAGRLAEVGA